MFLRKYGDVNFTKPVIRCKEKHPLKTTYAQMINRCTNSKDERYKKYGARGIGVCDSWRGLNGFSTFINDMGERPLGMTLDRIDNNKGYSKENCRWATVHQQCANKTNNAAIVGVSFNKTTKTWLAHLMVNRKRVLWKTFKTHNEALIARKEAEIKYLIN